MDDTTQSRVSDAAATRKRRSSILKSQRPARTPFSELEFSVATPTDTAKSRRVSFSRRTGVAEFVTNEATTTWKNFYEEHNKSLESSGNDSDLNAIRQPVEHLGKRIFDLQFEEIEAVDFMGSLNPTLGTNSSLNNINFTQQIASLECTSDLKLNSPKNDHKSKVNFSTVQHIGANDDLDDIERDLERVSNVVCPGPSDRHNISEYIEVDLNMTHMVKSDDCDMSITDTVHSPKVQDVSKNCSIDKKLNLSKDWVTDKENIAINPYAAPRETDNFAVNDEPNQVLVFDGKRLTLQTEKSEKEYRKTLLPNSSTETSQRKTIVLNTDDDLPNFVTDVSSKSEICFKSNIYNDFEFEMSHVNKVDIVPKRQTILDNTGNISITQALPSKIISGGAEKRRTMIYDEQEANVSMTQALPSKIISGPVERRRTMVYNADEGNISITQVLPSNIISDTAERRRTVAPEVYGEDNIPMTQALCSNIISGTSDRRRTMVYNQEEGNISITQALPSNIINEVADQRRTTIHDDGGINISMTQALPSNIISGVANKRQTMVYDQEEGNISMTQALPSNIISEIAEDRQSIVQVVDGEANMSVTQALLSNIMNGVTDKRRTMVYDQEEGNISMTQALPSNIISDVVEKRRNTVYDVDGEENVSITQALPLNIITAEKRRTMIYDQDEGNISMTQALPAKIISEVAEKRKTIIYNDEVEANASITQVLPSKIINGAEEKRRTMIYEQEEGDISMTQVLPANIISGVAGKRVTIHKDNDEEADVSMTRVLPSYIINGPTKRQTMVFEDEDANISVTQTIPTKIVSGGVEKRETKIFDQETNDLSVTQAFSVQIINDAKPMERRRTVLYENDSGNISITQMLPASIIQNDDKQQKEKCKTVIFDDSSGNISVTKTISVNSTWEQNGPQKQKSIVFNESDGNISIEQSQPVVPVFVVLDTEREEKRRTVIYEDKTGNISITQAAAVNLNLSQSAEKTEKRCTVVYQDDTGNISVTKTTPTKTTLGKTDAEQTRDEILTTNITLKDTEGLKRRSISFNNDAGNISVTQSIDSQLLPDDGRTIVTSTTDDISTTSLSASEDVVQNYNNDKANEIAASEFVYANIITPSQDIHEDSLILDDEKCEKPLVKNVPAVAFLLEGVVSHSLQDFNQSEDEVENDDSGDSDMRLIDTTSNAKVQNIIEESILQNSRVADKLHNLSMSRPIPTDLVSMQGEVLNKLVNKQLDLSVQNQDVLMYSSLKSDIESTVKRVQHENLDNEELAEDKESNLTLESKTQDPDVIKSHSTKESSEDLSIETKENAGHVIKPKVDVLNLRSADELMDIDQHVNIKSSSDKVNPDTAVMDALLDMSETSLKPEAKSVAVSVDSTALKKEKLVSNDSLFFIVREQDAVIQTDSIITKEEVILLEKGSNTPPLESTVIPAIENKILDTSSVLQKTLDELHLVKKRESNMSEKKDIETEPALNNSNAVDTDIVNLPV